jgi:hypothetical protein
MYPLLDLNLLLLFSVRIYENARLKLKWGMYQIMLYPSKILGHHPSTLYPSIFHKKQL